MAQKRNDIRLYLQPTCSRQDARPNILRILAGCNHARSVVKRIRKPAGLLQLIGGADFDEHDVQHPQDHIVGDRSNIGQSSGFLFCATCAVSCLGATPSTLSQRSSLDQSVSERGPRLPLPCTLAAATSTNGKDRSACGADGARRRMTH